MTQRRANVSIEVVAKFNFDGMFTGIVEKIGTVIDRNDQDDSPGSGGGVSATIGDCSEILGDVNLGDSISTNGVCLTVTELDPDLKYFKVGISPETLRRSNLGELKVGSKVNLERAVTSDIRLGGHIVQGHVDTIALITEKRPDGNAIWFSFQLRDPKYISYIVEKGFITVDGTSLTVTDVNYKSALFSIMMVSYTQEKVILPSKELGETVNIEVEFTGKLVEQQIELSLTSQLNDENSPLTKLISSLIDKKIASISK